MGLEELEALGLEELEALILEELEAHWFRGLEELEALVRSDWLEDLEDVGKVVRPKRWKRWGDEASPMELALPPEVDGSTCAVIGFNRIGVG